MVGELTCFADRCGRFHWFSGTTRPAEFFMGRGLAGPGRRLGHVRLSFAQELLLPLSAESSFWGVSVVLAVGSYKLRNESVSSKWRPRHHHFEQLGWRKIQDIVAFWSAPGVCTVCTHDVRNCASGVRYTDGRYMFERHGLQYVPQNGSK